MSDAAAFIKQSISDPGEPVIIFALEWCEFCWSVRKFFKKVGIEYHAIELDSVAYQEGARGRAIRNALAELTSMETIPQVFIGGEFVGGCTDVFDSWKQGDIQERLRTCAVGFDQELQIDPYSFLPEWLHPR